jgi:spore maturation protein CgeB
MTRIMVVGPAHSDSFAENVAQALVHMGHDVDVAGPPRKLRAAGRLGNVAEVLLDKMPRQDSFLQRHLLERQRAFRPDLVLTLDRRMTPSLVHQLKQNGARVALWFPDAVSNLGRHDVFIAGYDHIFLKTPALVRQLRTIHGLPVSYLPEACNPDWHRPQGPYGTREAIVVAGNVHPTRALLLDRMIRAGLPVEIYGPPLPSWIGFPAVRAAHTGIDIRYLHKAQVFRSARIVLNNLHPAEFSGVNCRLFEATGSGAVVLTERREGLEELFEIGREVVTFDSFDELVEQSHSLLGDSEAARATADAAAARSHRDHRYDLRLERLLGVLGF